MATEMIEMEKAEKTKPKTTRLYTMAENELYINLCVAVHQLKAPIEMLGGLNSRNTSFLKQAVSRLSPDVVLISLKDLKGENIKELEQIRMDYPQLGLVLLLDSCNAQEAEHLRKLALYKGVGGTAIFLKQRLESIEWLCSAITTVNQGQLMFDASLTAFMFAGKPGHTFLKKFSIRELEILNLIANGYTNAAIAAALFIDIKTVERHINNMYNKFKIDHEFNDKHLRVSIAKMYLEATGDIHREEDSFVTSPVNQV